MINVLVGIFPEWQSQPTFPKWPALRRQVLLIMPVGHKFSPQKDPTKPAHGVFQNPGRTCRAGFVAFGAGSWSRADSLLHRRRELSRPSTLPSSLAQF